jgi:hypothetical protein
MSFCPLGRVDLLAAEVDGVGLGFWLDAVAAAVKSRVVV